MVDAVGGDAESDLTAAIADARVAPYAITPGMDAISAHSRPTKIGIDSTVMVYCLFVSKGRFIRRAVMR